MYGISRTNTGSKDELKRRKRHLYDHLFYTQQLEMNCKLMKFDRVQQNDWERDSNKIGYSENLEQEMNQLTINEANNGDKTMLFLYSYFRNNEQEFEK
ncbi:MAG: hypothetical protein ACRCZ0_07865 [Cetobacterium sp.]